MQIINVPIGPDNIIVSEANDTLTLELKGTLLGTPEDLQLNFGLGTLLSLLATAIGNKIISLL